MPDSRVKNEPARAEVLEQVGMAPLAEAGYAGISGGRRQMVLIARALVQDTTALVLDEPTASLDYGHLDIVT